jgi:EpsD family peptidyl-prolyl cis-trans isomerase
MTTFRAFRIACLVGVVLVAGCQKEATGQVAAVVNGEEITLQEVNAELSSMQLPQGVDKTQAQKAALQRIVDRRLLAQAARDDGLDKTPEFLIRRRQLEDALLVQLLSQRVGRSVAVPDAKAIDAFAERNPALFSGRTIFTVDRIQFAAPADTAKLKALQGDHSMDAVASRLRQLGIEFSRDAGQLDSARLGQERLNQIRSLPPGEPFVLAENGVVTVAVITGSKPQPIEGDQARPAAVQLLRNQSLSAAMQQRLEAQKGKAKIEYQDSFSPPAPASTSAQTSKPAG